MNQKLGEIIITSFIVLLIAGMLTGGNVKNNSEIVSSNFESIEEYEVSGYTNKDPFVNNNGNKLCQINEDISIIISKTVNEGLSLFFKLLKKLVS